MASLLPLPIVYIKKGPKCYSEDASCSPDPRGDCWQRREPAVCSGFPTVPSGHISLLRSHRIFRAADGQSPFLHRRVEVVCSSHCTCDRGTLWKCVFQPGRHSICEYPRIPELAGRDAEGALENISGSRFIFITVKLLRFPHLQT